MAVPSAVRRASSWASDLAHPLPLAAVGLLALNDHVLKGARVLPGAVTGKLSDFAGLFFFPLLLAAGVRGASLVVRRRHVADRRSLAAAAAIATALGFAAVKLVPAVNAIVGRTWGHMVMDPTDLIALPMVGLAAAWMLRAGGGAHASDSAAGNSAASDSSGARSDARRGLDFAAVIAAAMASIATSQQPPPVAPPPPPPQAVAIAEEPSCAAFSIDTCERTSGQTLVVVRAQSRGGEACKVDVLRSEESSSQGRTAADVLPKNIVVRGSESKTFALTFLRPVPSHELSGSLEARARIATTGESGAQHTDEVEFTGECVAR
jgi:hypothetical protein